MQELFNLILTQLRNIWRFRWIALSIAWAIAVLGWLCVFSLPDEYHATARVHIDTQSAISPLLSGMAVTPDADQQVDLLIKTVMSRPNLREVARATGLDLQATSASQEQTLVTALSQRLTLSNMGGGNDIYRIDYTSDSAKTAQSVVQEIIAIMTTINLTKSNPEDDNSSQAVSFLAKEVDKYRDELSKTEKNLAQFKNDNPQLMPGTDDYVTRVQTLSADIDNLQDQLVAARSQRNSLAAQAGGGGGGVPAAQSAQVQRLDDQIDNQETRLSQLLTKYTPEHPDVLAAQRQLAELQSRRADTLADLKANPSQIQAPSAADNNRGAVAQQLSQAQGQISMLETSLSRKQSQLADLQKNSGKMSDAQAEFAELSRNYQVTRDQYEKLLSRLYSARLSTDVQQSTGGLEFRVIDPPDLPARPSGPPRVLYLLAVLIAAIVAGIAFALFVAQLRPVFSSRRALTQSLGYPVLGSISLAITPSERARRRRSAAIYVLCALSLLVGLILAVAVEPIASALVPNVLSPTL